MSPAPELERAILHTLAYADVFDYPLTAAETHRYLTPARASLEEVTAALDELARRGDTVARAGDWFVLRGRESLWRARMRRAETAKRLWPAAVFCGKLMACLPFVRMVAITGSLAMNNIGDRQDIDYLIVTAPGRLWTARAEAMLVVRIARLWGWELCPNYLVTEQALDLPQQSLYAAHELTQMIPLAGFGIYASLRQHNMWSQEFLPNAVSAPAGAERPEAESAGRLRAALEHLLNCLGLGHFESWEMQRKIRILREDRSANPEAVFSAEVCKGHFSRHAFSTEQALGQRLAALSME